MRCTTLTHRAILESSGLHSRAQHVSQSVCYSTRSDMREASNSEGCVRLAKLRGLMDLTLRTKDLYITAHHNPKYNKTTRESCITSSYLCIMSCSFPSLLSLGLGRIGPHPRGLIWVEQPQTFHLILAFEMVRRSLHDKNPVG